MHLYTVSKSVEVVFIEHVYVDKKNLCLLFCLKWGILKVELS